jgi:hypothetical protein
MQIFDFQANAGGSLDAKNFTGIRHMHHDQGSVIFVVARVEHTHHLHLFESGQHTRRCDLAIGCNERDGVTDSKTQLPGQIDAKHHPKLTRNQCVDTGHA